MTPQDLPPLPEPEFSMAYFGYEGWNDWPSHQLSELADDGIRTRTAFSADQMRSYALAAVEAAVEAERQKWRRRWMPMWLPVETAPRDGTPVLLVSANVAEPSPEIGHWSDEDGTFRMGYPDDWIRMAEHGLRSWFDIPIHWQHLPQAPHAITHSSLRPCTETWSAPEADRQEAVEAERQQAEADRKDAEQYRCLRDNTDLMWAICHWGDENGGMYYRDGRSAAVVDAVIDAAIAALPAAPSQE